MNASRALAGLLVLGVGVWFLFSVFRGSEEPTPPAMSFTSSEQCKECHPQAFEEWSGSQHSISWINPAVRALSNDFANQDCIDCHAPRPVFATGIGNRVLPRTTRRTEGVDCIACHVLPPKDDGTIGGVAATRADPRAACRPVERVELQRPDFCAACHNQHKTVDQWRESSWPDRGEDCLSCHMPYRDGDITKGRDHRFLGGNHLPMLQEAVELRGNKSDGGWTVELENIGAGHAFPTDERSRAADLFWRKPGEKTWTHLYRIRDPYRTETDLPRTLLDADETLTVQVPEEGAIEVALFYKRSPYWSDPENPDPENEATLVHRIELSP